MSFFSSLCLFYPGKPPKLSVGDLRAFSEKLRAQFAFGTFLQGVEMKYGQAIDQDFKKTDLLQEVAPGMWQPVKYPWDHRKSQGPWADLWPDRAADTQTVYRSSIRFGSLPKPVSRELTAISADERSYIAPDSLSLIIDPFSPGTLAGETRGSRGWIHLALSGNGYFTWQPLQKYWEQIRTAPSLATLQRLCRECFPLPAFSPEELQGELGELFLNLADYQPGDWIVTVSETG